MKIFLTGATGYVGSVVAEKLKGRGHKLIGLARGEESEAKLRGRGIEPLRGELGDIDLLKRTAAESDAVIHTAFSHNFADYNDAVRLDRSVIAGLDEALTGANKPFVATSSSAVLGDTGGDLADEDYPFDENSPRRLRGEAERDVLQLSAKGIRSIVLRLPLFVYGRGGSSFLPFLIKQARAAGSANYVAAGDHKVSAVHVEDVADLYVCVLETSTAKGLYNAAAEDVSLRELNEAVARLLNVEPKSISKEEARAQFGGMFDFLSINNRLSAEKAKRELGWSPRSHLTILDDIEHGSYRSRSE